MIHWNKINEKDKNSWPEFYEALAERDEYLCEMLCEVNNDTKMSSM